MYRAKRKEWSTVVRPLTLSPLTEDANDVGLFGPQDAVSMFHPKY